MNCESFRENIDNFENLCDKTKLEMTKHSVECESCREELDFMLSIIEATKSLPKIEPPSDFMEKLNIRIDIEESKRRSLPIRIFTNVRTNWKQYAAAAACFAVVAVVVSNGKMFTDNMNGTDDGIIYQDTVVTGDNNPVSTASPNNTAAVPNGITEPKTPSFEGITAENRNTNGNMNGNLNSRVTATNAPAPVNTNTNLNTNSTATRNVSNITSTVKSNNARTNNTVVNTPIATPAADLPTRIMPVGTPNIQQQIAATETMQPTQTEIDGYKIANTSDEQDNLLANVSTENSDDANMHLRSVYSLPVDDGVAEVSENTVEDEYSIATGDKIAFGRYQKIDKDGNPIEEEPKAVGSIKISSDDVDQAMDVILQYSVNVDGDFYATNSERLSVMLSCFIQQGIDYTNYTPAYSGDIKFKLVFN